MSIYWAALERWHLTDSEVNKMDMDVVVQMIECATEGKSPLQLERDRTSFNNNLKRAKNLDIREKAARLKAVSEGRAFTSEDMI